ncbi:MAG TPA: DUF3455 domain-containing protein [Steroidobacteraceae bacterium]|jgi:hypothetical protein|nr:DUF3455 domain-containing protein [Steroidobacteraceae bacterium]
MRSSSFIAAAIALAAPFAAMATHIDPPKVPDTLAVPAGSKAFLIGHAVGTQNYICLPDGAGAKWVLFGPQATVFDDAGKQIMTHFLSPNPAESGTPRATWQHSDRTSAVWAMKVAESDDARYVEPGAIKWFLLKVMGAEEGSRPHDRLTQATVIQRVNTSGGVAPASECTATGDVGKTKFVPYTADYVFYK